MNDIKNKNFSFTAAVFSGKLFSLIAATMLLLLVDGAIHDAPAVIKLTRVQQPEGQHGEHPKHHNADPTQQTQQYPRTLESHHQRLQALSDKAGLKMNPNAFATSLESHRERLYYLEVMAGITTTNDPYEYNSLESQHQRLEALEQAFANNPPTTEQTSGTQDLINNGINPTETPYPMAVCNALVNSQNLCTEQTVTAVVAALAVGLIGGIVAIVQTEINNKQNTDKQRENSNNLLTLLLLSQQKQQCVPSLSNNYTCP